MGDGSVPETFSALRQVVNADSEYTTGGLEVMERVNINATNKYMNLVDAAAGLDTDKEYLRAAYNTIDRYCKQADTIEKHIDHLEMLAKEVDEWSRELEVKTRKQR
ncbi:hypothetical protein TRVA0_052S00210 [Trichomonascus vanleenenianus]|uniref:biogenesis of lysosome-related organelles complex 1 subunit 2 n=1 Tax=Trichomonascus vanleenenianus TaxID=2268995 RepID=UPI003ECB3662